MESAVKVKIDLVHIDPSLFGKVLEKAVFECTLAHVRPALPGFIPHRSCDSNLVTLLQATWDAIINIYRLVFCLSKC